MSAESYTPDSTQEPQTKGSGKSDANILSIARTRLNTVIGAVSNSRGYQLDDLKFAAGNSDNLYQWPTDVQDTRVGNGDPTTARPMLTVNKLPSHIHQVTNDQRQNRPSGNVVAANGDASVEIAEIFEGIVRHIEQISFANTAYDTASESQVTQGEGYWRILTDYESEDSFDQEIYIKRIRNPFCVYMDPKAQEPTGEDANWCIIIEDLTKEEYADQYPDSTPVSNIETSGIGDEALKVWVGADFVRIAEYFYYETWTEKLYQWANGKTAFKDTPEYQVYTKHLGNPVKSRNSTRKKLKWCKISGYEILEQRDWPGKYIPVVRVVGNEFEIDGEIQLSGIVRNAKDPQRMYNYHCSAEVEMLALAPKAPFIGAAGQFEGYEDDWATANTKNHPYLQYNPVVDEATGQPLAPPQRVVPPMVQSGLIQAKNGASEDIKDATGQYNASLGQTSNERSGKAILARQHEGDVSTYHYGDNFSRSICWSTNILLDLIPKIYDRPERVARIIGEDRASKMVKLDPTQQTAVTHVKDEQGNTIEKIYNPNVGKYDVTVVSGPGYATKRREALEQMAQLLQGNPELWSVAGDLFVKNMDWPGAMELSKRFQKTMDPKLFDDSDENPAFQKLKQQFQELMQQYQQAMGMLKNIQHSMEAKHIDIEFMKMKLQEREIRIKEYDAETKRIAAVFKPAQGAGMNETQVQDIALGVVHATQTAGDLGGAPIQMPQDAPQGGPTMPPGQPPQQAPMGAPQEPQPQPQQPAPGGV